MNGTFVRLVGTYRAISLLLKQLKYQVDDVKCMNMMFRYGEITKTIATWVEWIMVKCKTIHSGVGVTLVGGKQKITSVKVLCGRIERRFLISR